MTAHNANAPARADAAARQLVDRLLALGWRDGTHPRERRALLHWRGAQTDQFGGYSLTFHDNSWDADVTVAPTFEKDAIFVEASIRGAAPCYWRTPQD